ncbi:MAG TPA: acetyl-CoA carboxylase biotin carboxylase subunit [Terriglobales bacterium]|nr:acetyl-CoA carboxylase biotin carboxylase subunit [Terriglobales bacterium]
MFKRILIANRGEIAVRIIRACRELGIESVAVFSDVDRKALHVRKADYAYHIGPATASESYLNIDKILEAARRSGAEAIHPGYGFLSENANFARACRDAGIKFIGPSPESMEMMGSKTRARQNMKRAGVPFVPGSERGLELDDMERLAEQVGYPVMLKAAAGGGGKGMRLVSSPAELHSAYENARSEAQRSFGDNEVYIEKFIANPRHVEMQIFGDEQGNVVYLGERECSVQRRHQKVLEESPSPIVDEDMRRRMGEIAVRVGKAAGYYNAGTVEFLVDRERNFYFLEMNTRLQVEHPVTEFVTGLDLVHLQFHVATGQPLPFKQEDIQLRGHAIECRIYAEDPDNNYFPSPGKITRLISPSGPGIRRDSGMYEGWSVPIEYDPLLAKLVGYGEDREQAINRLLRALYEYFVGGIKTNTSLFRRILKDPDFRAGNIDTGFLDRLLTKPNNETDPRRPIIAAMGAAIFASAEAQATLPGTTVAVSTNGKAAPPPPISGWKRMAREEAVRER